MSAATAGPAARASTTCRSSARSRCPAWGRSSGNGLRHATAVQSANWAGYADTNDTFNSVASSWTEPTVNCAEQQLRVVGRHPGTEHSGRAARWPGAASAFWVGLDGYTSTSVEQLGTDSDCDSGTPSYYAWYEMYPNPSVTLPSQYAGAAGRPDDGAGVVELGRDVVHADDQGRHGRLDLLDHAVRQRLRPFVGRGDRRGTVVVQPPVLQRGAAGRLRPGRLLGLVGDRRVGDQGIAVGASTPTRSPCRTTGRRWPRRAASAPTGRRSR